MTWQRCGCHCHAACRGVGDGLPINHADSCAVCSWQVHPFPSQGFSAPLLQALLHEAVPGRAVQPALAGCCLTTCRQRRCLGIGLAFLDVAGASRAVDFFSSAMTAHLPLSAPRASASHFLMKLAFAAPASFFSAAWASQVESAAWTWAMLNRAARMASIRRFMTRLLLGEGMGIIDPKSDPGRRPQSGELRHTVAHAVRVSA